MANLEELFPIDQAEHPLRFPAGETRPAAILHQELKRVSQKHSDEVDRLLVAIGNCCFHLPRVAGELAGTAPDAAGPSCDALEILHQNLKEVLDEYGVRLVDLTGDRWSVDDNHPVEVRGHCSREDLDEPRIVHMERPIIRRGDRLLQQGAVMIESPVKE